MPVTWITWSYIKWGWGFLKQKKNSGSEKVRCLLRVNTTLHFFFVTISVTLFFIYLLCYVFNHNVLRETSLVSGRSTWFWFTFNFDICTPNSEVISENKWYRRSDMLKWKTSTYYLGAGISSRIMSSLLLQLLFCLPNNSEQYVCGHDIPYPFLPIKHTSYQFGITSQTLKSKDSIQTCYHFSSTILFL